MDVEYHLTPDDLYAYQWRAAYLSPGSRRSRRRGYLYVLLPLAVVGLLPSIGSEGFRFAGVSLLFLVVVLPIVALSYGLFVRFALQRAIRAQVAREKPECGQLGRHHIVLSPDGVTETTAVGQTVTRWTGVDRIEQNDDYIFIYTAPAAAHIIPKRAFPGAAADVFHRCAVEYLVQSGVRTNPG